MDGPNELECYITEDWRGLPRKKHSSLLGHSYAMKQMKNGSNKVECYITKAWKVWPEINNLAC